MKKIITLLSVIFSLQVSAQSNINWGMAMNLASSTFGNHQPRIVTDAAGNPLVLWGSSNRAIFSRWNGTAFTTPVMVNPMTMPVAETSYIGSNIASHGDTVYVVFKQTPEADTASHIQIVRSFNGGISFSLPVRVDNIGDSASRFPNVTTDALGNPIVSFMKFNSAFGDARWVVAKSTDFGSTFLTDVLASGWSSATSTVCDCCPGAITSSGSTVAMLYRDNNSNIRDTWAGISADGGSSFTQGVAVDQGNWMLMSCPVSGPDGVIVDDTLYSVYMNGTTGTDLTWFSKTPLMPPASSAGVQLTGSFPGLTQQNYPRIAHSANAMAIVWRHTASGTDQLPLLFTDNISNGFPAAYDTVALNHITNADVALANGNIIIVWQDDNSGTVKYRKGTFTVTTGAEENTSQDLFTFSPNPATNQITIQSSEFNVERIEMYNVMGGKVKALTPNPSPAVEGLRVDVSSLPKGIYFITLTNEAGSKAVRKFVKM